MTDIFEATLLPYNKQDNNGISIISDSISIKKSLIDDLCYKHDLDLDSLILAATCITLTKFINDTEILIYVDNSILHFNDENRDRTVIDYIENIKKHFINPSKQLDIENHFNFCHVGFDADEYNTTLFVGETSNLYSLKLRFDENKYTNSYINSFLRSIKKVLNQFMEYGIDRLKIEDIALRDENKKPEFKLIRNPLVNELLENQAKKTPEKIALRCCCESYTFRQINDEANRIANALIKRGIRKGSKISFMLPRNKTLITTFLGIIKAGCVAIPIDMNFPDKKIDYIRKNADSKYVITFESTESAINPQDLINEGNVGFPEVDLKADDPIFMLYTSGSTGNPKGVVLTHCGISNLISVHIKNNYKKLLSISSIAFDISEEDILVALTNDKELIFADDDEINDIVLLSRLIERTKPEFVNLTPSRLLSYVQVPEFAQALKQFKAIGCGGEPFTKNVFESIKKYADIDIYNGYGPLETSLTSNSKKIENPDFITNGKPLLNYITDVRDIDGKLLPYGVMGELYIGGVGVSKGYYKMEERTDNAFISINGVNYYKSGDYAVQLPSDEIIIKGRVDNQIKLRGQRVDPEEIEQVILKYPNISNCVVAVHEWGHENHLCAYFTSKINIDTNDLKNFLKDILSSFMVPTFFMQLDKIPETPNGKIDRKMLPKPKLNTENELPVNNFERMLYNSCSNILNHDDFGVTDNLFKLGFTSLTLMKLNSDIYHEFHITLKHADLMDNPTIRNISNLLRNSTSIENIEKIKPSKSNIYPMSSQQKRLYVIWTNNPELTNYNLTNVIKLENTLDINKLEKAINEVIDAEEILRTSFHMENGEFIQKIHEKRPINVDLIKVGNGDDIEEILLDNVCPFDLENDSLLRFKIIKSNEDTYIFRDIHHIIGDQISNDLLFAKIKDAYYGKSIKGSAVQYKDYTLWVKTQQEKEREYWINRNISDFGTELFSPFKRPLKQTFNGNKISHALDKRIIEKIAKDNNTTVYKLLLSQFIVLLHKYTHENDIQIGTVTSGRTHPELEHTLGMFVNTLPLIQSISIEDTLNESIGKTEKEISDLFTNQNYSIEQIISDHKISTNSSYNPLFNIVFIQNTAKSFNSDLFSNKTKFDLSCTVKNYHSRLFIELEYNSDLYSSEMIAEFLEDYVYLIDNVQQNLDKKIKDIKILSPSKEEKIIKLAGRNKQIPHDSILDALNKRIRKNPNQIILSDDSSSIDYNDFNLKTNSLANYLMDKFAVKEQDNVILIAERSIESVLAFYSILKLNAVYVPMDSNTPKNRLKHIIDVTDAKVILTNVSLDFDDAGIVDLNQEFLYDYDIGKCESKSTGNLCIIHTSGTTGLPKGVQITSENIVNFLYNAKTNFYGEEIKIFYHTTNIGFDTSLFELLFSILNGIRLHIINERYDFKNISEDILNQKSIINTVPSKLKMFLTLPNFEDVMKNVNRLILAGEALKDNLVDEIYRNYNPIVYNAYGPCEATIFVTIKEIVHPNRITIGKPNLNTRIYILNDEKQLCPIGVPGELCIAGKQVSEGYLKDDAETNKSFIDNPYGEGKLYCSGDLAYLGNDGEITYIQRMDNQIKINGQRIEVDEINRQIENNPHITGAVTITNSNKTQLHSYFTADKIIDTKVLLNDLQSVLLPFMVPASMLQIDSIPLNDSGKIDVGRLPEIHKAKNEYVAPSNDVEKLMVDIWEDVLDVKPIGINDNFYHLGGDSIKAIRIISLLQNHGINCNARDILSFKTPYLIAMNVSEADEISYDFFEGNVDLLPIQSYFFDEINRNDFTQEFVLKSKIDVDVEILQKSLDKLSVIHDMLRASYKIRNGKAIQEILSVNTKIFEINEYYVDSNIEESIREIVFNARKKINIENKLTDVSIVYSGDESYLIFVIHHLIVDGVSWSILIDDLSRIYQQISSDEEIDVKKPYPYKYWVNDIKKLVKEVDESEKRHLIEISSSLEDLDIAGESKVYSLDMGMSFDANNLLMLSEEEYWALAISRAYKKTYGDDVIFNYESYGRDESIADVNRTFGWFTTQYPILVEVNGEFDRISLMEDVYNVKNAFKSVDNLGLNYGSLVYISGDLKFHPCPITFNFLSTEFEFKNELLESVDFISHDDLNDSVYVVQGITMNILRVGNAYRISGRYPMDTFLGHDFDKFIENIKFELEFLSKSSCDDNIVCCLSESQLNVYLDEMMHDMGTAYSTNGIVNCGTEKSVEDVISMIHLLIDKHPILKGRIVDANDTFLLSCDSYPSIEVSDTFDYSKMIKPFDMDELLARFYVVDIDDEKLIFYDIHHVISDAVSIKIIEKELNCILNGDFDEKMDVGFVYASRVSFEDKFDPIYNEGHEFFKNTLNYLDDVNYLIPDYGDDANDISLPIKGIRRQVEEFCENNNITVSSFLNAIFAYAYSRFTGSNRVLYNFTEHGRHSEYFQDSLGMYVRTIPIVVDCSDKSLEEYMSEVSSSILNSMYYSIYPFRLLSSEFDLNKDVVFEYNYDLNDVSFVSDEITSQARIIDNYSEFLCCINETGDGYVVTIEHSNKYSDEMSIRFVNVFREILIQSLYKENLRDIDFVGGSDLKLLDSVNQTQHPLKHDDILDAFNHNLSALKDNDLVTAGKISYSHGECAFIANEISKLLTESGITIQDNVAFLVERSEYYLFSILGILSRGAVYVPLDDNLPDEQIKFILNDLDINVLLVNDGTYERAGNLFNNQIINLSDILRKPLGSLSKLPAVYGDCACILYTSGTTGVPKGVKITRKSIVNISEYYTDKYNLKNEDAFGLFSAIGFDVSNFVLNVCLYSGACLAIVPEDIRLNMSELNRFFNDNNVTHVFITTQVAKLFMGVVDNVSLKVLLVGGEKLGQIENLDDYVLIDAYGPTEAFAFVSFIENSKKIDYSSVGMPNYNTKFYVLDSEMRRLPVGAVGELYLAGYQIADGYLNRDVETSKAFVDNPFDSNMDYGVLYRTGDMVRMLNDGSLGFIGRADNQVKIRGNRVELLEIESVIHQMDFVEDVTVQTIKNEENTELVAYVVLSDKVNNVFDSVCDFVRKYKPNYMVPHHVITVDSIPVNINGKVDLNALPKVNSNHDGLKHASPKTANEKRIVEAFQNVFNDNNIGLFDDFIMLGGDSIKAIRVISLLQKENIECNARDILTFKSPYLISKKLEKSKEITYDAVEGNVDLLPIQSFFFEEINRNDFTQEFILKSKIDLDVDILQKSLDELSNVHDMLRTRYNTGNGDVIQEIMPVNTKIFEINELNMDCDIEKSVSEIIFNARKSINIENKLNDVSLLRNGSESYVIFVIHHLIVDGVSWSILIDDLTHIYQQILSNKEIDAKKPYPYKYWVNDVKKLANEIDEKEKMHWTQINSLLGNLDIEGESKSFAFNSDICFNKRNLLMLSEEELWALAIARAYRKTYGENVIFNRESYGRDETIANVNRTFGWFTTQYPVLVESCCGMDSISLIEDVCNIKKSFNEIKNLGLNYESLIYLTDEIKYKHCPVTFNFLSNEFMFENDLFKSENHHVFNGESQFSSIANGITFNVSHMNDNYVVSGEYPEKTYLGDKFEEFVDNIKSELNFITEFSIDGDIACPLSESQLLVYLDELQNDKNTSYSTYNYIESNRSIDEINDAIRKLIDKHPILKGRISDNGDLPLLVCDSYPSVESVESLDYSAMISPFDLNKSLARFYIVNQEGKKLIFYDVHHVISDGVNLKIIENELNSIISGDFEDDVDLGFVQAGYDSFMSQFSQFYEISHDFFKDNLANVNDASQLMPDGGKEFGEISIPVRGIRPNVEEFCKKIDITVGSFFNAVFAYACSRFTGGEYVRYSFVEHGRHQEYMQKSLGMYARTIPIVVDCRSSSVKDYLINASGLILDSMKYGDYPFRLLAKEFNLNNGIIFEYNFDLNDTSFISDDIIFKKPEIRPYSDILCYVNEFEDGYVLRIDYSENYSKDYCTGFLKLFEEILIQMLNKNYLDDITG